jgi:hypothetical protein
MAEIKKFKSPAVKNIFLHVQRKQNDGHTHKNENIDLSKTPNNYSIKSGKLEDWNERMNNVFHLKSKNLVSFAEVVVTLPKDVKPQDERDFFSICYDFFKKDFGEENIIYATVHKDEITPHLHLGFVPVKEGKVEYDDGCTRSKKAIEDWKKKHNGEAPTSRICYKELCDREYYYTLHPRLQEFCDSELGYHTSIINGATVSGNKTVLELKVKTLEENKETLEREIKNLEQDKKTVKLAIDKLGIQSKNFDLYPLLNDIRNLQNENEALKKIIMRNGFSCSSSDFPKSKVLPIKSSSLNVYSGNVNDFEIPHNSVVVVEVPRGKPIDRTPQAKIINSDEQLQDLALQMSMAYLSEDERVRLYHSKKDNKVYALCQTSDNNQEIVNLLLLLNQMAREIEDIKQREMFMQRFSQDEYDFARTIFSKAECQVNYFEGKEVIERYEREAEKIQDERERGEQ